MHYLTAIESKLTICKTVGDLQETIALFQRAVLCGEQYKNISTDKINAIGNQLTQLEIAYMGNSTLLTAVQKIRLNYFDPFMELAGTIAENMGSYLQGKKRNGLHIRRFKRAFLEEDTLQLSIAAAPQGQPTDIAFEQIYKINILLAYIDEDLHCDESILEDLSLAKKALENWSKKLPESGKQIVPVLKDKIDFFQFKINYRYNHPRNGDEARQAPANFPELTLDNAYQSLYKRVVDHYKPLSDEKVQFYSNSCISFKPDEGKFVLLEPYHHLKRYYRKKTKDLIQSTDKVNALLAKLDQNLLVEPKSLYGNDNVLNTIAAATVQNLFKNVAIKIELDLEVKRKYETILHDLHSFAKPSVTETANRIIGGWSNKAPRPVLPFLSRIQRNIAINYEGTGVKDFYGNIIFLAFLSEMITWFKSNPEMAIDFDKYDTIKLSTEDKKSKILQMVDYVNGICDDTMQLLETGFRMLATHNTMPTYLTMEECHTDWFWPDSRERLFIRSSYILPHDLAKIETKIKSYEILMQAQKNSLRDTFEVALSQAEIKSGITDFEKKVKENEFKVVQIVGIFVTIATFVLANVKIFDNKSGMESFGIILGLVACFFIFNLFIYILVLPTPKKTLPFIFAGIKLIGFLLIPAGIGYTSYYILTREVFKANEQIRGMEGKMFQDSTHIMESVNIALYKNQARIDSMFTKKRSDSISTVRYIDEKLRNAGLVPPADSAIVP